MKLLIESCEGISALTEAVEEGGHKKYFLEGIFMQSNRPNKNNRIYPKSIMEEGLSAFQSKIAAKGSVGELGHPASPAINQHLVSHVITEMHWDGDNVVGRAKVIDTPNGKIVKTFIDEGIQIGMSSRAVGQVRQLKSGLQEVYKNFKLSTVDIVADPSAPDAFVQGLYEGKEWVMENGVWTSIEAEQTRDTILEASTENLTEAKIAAFTLFLQKLNRMV